VIKNDEMKQITILSVLMLAGWVRAGTIVYSYDEQQRLAGANISRSASQSGPDGNQATVTCDYDKADNMIGYTVLTDSQYFKPFLFCISGSRGSKAGSA
jgi:hypothetical protein